MAAGRAGARPHPARPWNRCARRRRQSDRAIAPAGLRRKRAAGLSRDVRFRGRQATRAGRHQGVRPHAPVEGARFVAFAARDVALAARPGRHLADGFDARPHCLRGDLRGASAGKIVRGHAGANAASVSVSEDISSVVAECAAGEVLEPVAAPSVVAHDGADEPSGAAPQQFVLPEELEFYRDYAWALNPHLSFDDGVERLHGEAARLAHVPRGWQTDEVVTNIFLLAGGLLNSTDEYLREPSLRLPWKVAALRLGRGARWVTENALTILRPRRP